MSHGELLRQHSEDPQLASHVMHDCRNAGREPKTRAMLDYAFKLTKEPEDIHQEDFDHLKEVGLDEQELLATVLITCAFAFVTRLADGLGVGSSGGRQEWVESWLMGPARDQEWLLQAKQ